MKKFLIFTGSVLLVFVFLAISFYIKFNKPYTEIINLNWSIILPKDYKVIYSADSGPSFNGDGERYHIFEYKNEENVDNSLKWKSEKNDNFELKIKEILDNLNVSNESRPDFQSKYKYYSQMKEDNSEIYLIFMADTKKLYVIEDIF
jgi:hypothetical protein